MAVTCDAPAARSTWATAKRDAPLVDDVMTTGATAREVTAVLRDAGATRVSWWVVARTPRPDG